jgi:catechol 2,3-dioxygenase-like lactoylglutathione lyase family enzyme
MDLYLDHMLIGVRDLSQTARDYNKLGFKVTPEGRHPGRGTHNRLVVFGPEYLELISIHDASQGLFRPNLAPFLESREGLFIFAMGTSDIDEIYAEMQTRGVAAKTPEPGSRHAEDGSTAYSWTQMEIDDDAVPGSQTFAIQHNDSFGSRYPEPPSAAEHPNGVMGIHHLALAVNDADAAAQAWTRAFGMASTSQAPDSPGTRRVRLNFVNCALDMMSPTGPGPLANFLERHGEAPYHLAFEVADLDATARFMNEQGVTVGARNKDSDGAGLDLDASLAGGVPIRLIQQD